MSMVDLSFSYNQENTGKQGMMSQNLRGNQKNTYFQWSPNLFENCQKIAMWPP